MSLTVEVPCFCEGKNPGCVKCFGSGVVKKVACERCNGSGFEAGVKQAGKCYNCRGLKYREIDNELSPSSTERVL